MDTLLEKAAKIKLVILDVDGVLTDGKVTYTSEGEELKSFNIKDGLGIKLLQKASIKVGIITGRNSPMVARRASELSIDPIVQGREDKAEAMKAVAETCELTYEQIAYMGDDLPDLGALRLAGLAFAPADAHAEVLAVTDWTATRGGGQGAVREMCDHLLTSRGDYARVVASF